MIRTPELRKAQQAFTGKHAELSENVIGVFYQVHSELGYGFSEKVYQKALAIALRDAGLSVEEQTRIEVYYHGQCVGEYYADMIVNKAILLELKAGDAMLEEHKAQLLNYLKATDYEVGFVMNFGKSATFSRKVFDNERKGSPTWMKKP